MGNTEVKREQEIKTRAVSRNMWRVAEVCTTHASALQQQVGPRKSSKWTCRGSRPSGPPCSHPCSPPGSPWGILRSEFPLPRCGKCDVRLERGEWGLAGDIQRFVRAEQGPSGACVSVSVPERDAEVAEFASEGLAASSQFMCHRETVRATKVWTTSVRSSSFSLLLSRK